MVRSLRRSLPSRIQIKNNAKIDVMIFLATIVDCQATLPRECIRMVRRFMLASARPKPKHVEHLQTCNTTKGIIKENKVKRT